MIDCIRCVGEWTLYQEFDYYDEDSSCSNMENKHSTTKTQGNLS